MAVTAVVVVLGFLMFQYGGALFSGTLSGFISSPLRGQYLAVHSPATDIEFFLTVSLFVATLYVLCRRRWKDRKRPRLRSLPGGKKDEDV
jgi:hypothetical protein